MANVAIGYNISQVKKLMGDIKSKFEGLKGTISNEWGTVSKTLQTEWIGLDEVSYENELAKRISQLYENAAGLANYAITVMADTANGWGAFQANNLLEGATSGGQQITVDASEYKVTVEENIVSGPGTKEFGENTDFGLKEANSAETIQDSVSTYVGNVKTKCNDLFGETKSSNAFFGEGQTKQLDSLLEKCEESIGVVTTAVKDLNDALAALAGSDKGNYGSQVSAVASVQSENISNVDKTLDEKVNAKTRWTSES